MTDLNKLKEPFPRHCISWRVGSTDKKRQEREQNDPKAKATKGIALAYIDARDVMQRLDDVCGAGAWQCSYPHANGKTSCRIGIKIGDDWVWKENGCGDSQVEAEKGAFSDALKRAAVLWGIGRYLYDVPNVWVDLDQWGAIKDLNDPRLSKALEAAEKGIRIAGEPEPEAVKTANFTEDEMALMRVEINKATSADLLKEIKSKLVAAKPRMNAAQIEELRKGLAEKEKIYA